MEDYSDNREYCPQLLIDKQDLMNSTICYNIVVENCIDYMNKYINSLSKKEKNSESKKDFLFQLECLNSMVKEWNISFPRVEPKLKKNINKKKLINNIKLLIKKAESANSTEDKKYFERFLLLLENNNEVEFLGKNKVMSNFEEEEEEEKEDEQNKKKKTLHLAHKMIDKSIKLDKYIEEQKTNGYEDYDMDY